MELNRKSEKGHNRSAHDRYEVYGHRELADLDLVSSAEVQALEHAGLVR